VVEEPTDIMAHWRDDLVAFVLGCFVLVRGSADGGRPADPSHRAQRAGADVSHQYRLRAFGPFAGPMVVSMRPFKPADAIRAVQITFAIFPPCMARRFTSAIRIRSASPISPSPITVERPVPVEADESSDVLGVAA